MRITFDPKAPPMADAQAEEFARSAIKQQRNVRVSNRCVFDWLRAVLLQTPIEQRPQVTWIVEEKEVHFDKDLRSNDAWGPALEVGEQALEVLLDNQPKG